MSVLRSWSDVVKGSHIRSENGDSDTVVIQPSRSVVPREFERVTISLCDDHSSPAFIHAQRYQFHDWIQRSQVKARVHNGFETNDLIILSEFDFYARLSRVLHVYEDEDSEDKKDPAAVMDAMADVVAKRRSDAKFLLGCCFLKWCEDGVCRLVRVQCFWRARRCKRNKNNFYQRLVTLPYINGTTTLHANLTPYDPEAVFIVQPPLPMILLCVLIATLVG